MTKIFENTFFDFFFNLEKLSRKRVILERLEGFFGGWGVIRGGRI